MCHFWPVLRAVEAVKGLDPMRYGTVLPPHTLIRMSRGEIHLDPVKKMVYWVSNNPEWPKQAKMGHFGLF